LINSSLNNLEQIKLGAIISYVSIVFNIIAGLIYTPWMVAQIGVSDYGLYSLVSSFLTYFIIDFGLGEAIARFITKYRVEKQENKINELLGLTSKVYLAINLLVLLILVVFFFLIESIFKELNPVELQKFKTIYCIAGFFSLLSFPFTPLNGVLIAYERFVVLKFCDLFSKVGTIAFMVFSLLLGYKLYALVAINAVVGIIIIIFKFFYLSRTTTIIIDFNYKSKELSKQLFGFSIWASVIGVAQRLLLNIAPTLLAIFSGTAAIAVFSIGNIIEGYVWTFAGALNGLFLPKVSSLASVSGDRNAITNLMIRVGRIQLFVVGILYVGIITMGQEFIILWMGVAFTDSYPIVVLLILPGLVTLTQGIASTLMYVENKIKYIAVLHISSSSASVLISFFLIPKFGALGAAIGIFIALLIFQIIGMNVVYYKKMKINIFHFFNECFLKMSLPIGLSFLISFAINYFIPASSFLVFFPKVMVIGGCYFVLMWFLGLNNNEKELITSLLKPVLNILDKERLMNFKCKK
jgi:O-antigen/teichoic acid export membrane protein